METPSFLQPVQKLTEQSKKNFFGEKKWLSIVGLIVLLLGIPLAVLLLQKTQIFAPKAEVKPIELVSGPDNCVVSTDPNKVNCPTFPIKLTSPLESSASAQPSASTSASPTASASPTPLASPSPSPSVAPIAPPAPETTPVAFSCVNGVTNYIFNLFSPANETGITAVQVSPNSNFSTIYENTTSVQSGNRLLFKGPGNFSNNFQGAFQLNTTYYARLMRGSTPGAGKAFSVATCPPDDSNNNDPNNNNNTDGGSGDTFLLLPQVYSQAKNLLEYFEISKITSLLSLSNVFAQTASPSPGTGILIKASPNPCILGSNGLCTATVTLNAGNNSNLQIKLKETGASFTGPGANPTGSWAAPWITAGGYTFELYSNSILIDLVLVKGVPLDASPSPTASASSSVSPSASPSASPVTPVKTVSYKVAETEAGLASAPVVPYAQHPTVTSFTFMDTVPGSKQIWAEFIRADGSSQKEHISVELLEPDPVLTSLDCSMDISKQNLKLTLNGLRLGSGSGKIKANDKDAQILTWSDTQASATIKPEGSLEDGKLFKVVLTRSDGKILPETTCLVNTTILSLGARLFCREPGTFDVSRVKVVLADENGNRVNEVVTIDKDGLIKGLKTKLQAGKRYAISVKAPFSLRRNAQFTASNGTNLIGSMEEETSFILPVGDISPVIAPDGKINTLDRSEIIRQWSVLGIGSNKTGDFNQDTKVNSIDWACMRYDFNKEDDAVPVKAISPSPSPTAMPSVTDSPSATPSPGTRTALFLLAPEASGSYKLNTEFGVDLNISSSNEPGNLFVAKLLLVPHSNLEVVRIEKASGFNWTEEYFNNQDGEISLVAGVPAPGLKTTGDSDIKMARIILKGKQVGVADINLTEVSKIYANSDSTNILKFLQSQKIEIKP